MTHEEARTARLIHLCADSHSTEKRIRAFAAILVDDFDPLRHIVEERRVTWPEHRNRGYVAMGNGGTLEPAAPLRTLRILIPGNDFAAQLVVEEQIREQLTSDTLQPA